MQARETQGKESATRRKSGWSRLTRFSGAPIALGVVAGLVICGLIYLAITLFSPHSPHQPDIQPTARAICADLTGQRYDDLYTRLTPALQGQGTEAQFVASQRELDQLQGKVTACVPGTPAMNGATGTVAFTLTRAGSAQPVAAQATLAASGGVWRVASYSGAF